MFEQLTIINFCQQHSNDSYWLLPVIHSSALWSKFRCSVGPWFLLFTETDESVFWADEHSRRESRVTAANTLHASRCHWVASGQMGPPQGDQYRGPHAHTSGINFAEYIQVMTAVGWSNDDTMFLFIRGFHRKVLVIWWRLEMSELHPNLFLRMPKSSCPSIIPLSSSWYNSLH